MMNPDQIEQALHWVERQTNLRTKRARMLSNGVQGEFLQAFSLMLRPRRILELGTFTGYSTIALSRGLAPDGEIVTVEIFDELEDVIREGFARAGIADRVRLLIGDAATVVPALEEEFDLVYIDANKREYCRYYDLVFDKVAAGGYILADNVLWDGKVLLPDPPKDAQTQSIIAFNRRVEQDGRVAHTLLPLRDGLSIIRKKEQV